MPLNELEIHPFLESINDKALGPEHFNGLIIGSFPVYAITNSILPNGDIEERFIEDQANLKYFYGSNQNSFWKLISTVFETPNPATIQPEENRIQHAKNLLIDQNLLITDSLFKTNRKEMDAQDSALMVPSNLGFVDQNKSLNLEIDRLLQRNSNIKFLYFTSNVLNGKSPFGWFRQIFGIRLHWQIITQVGTRVVSAEVIIDGRTYHSFFLPSPAGDGMRGLQFTDNRRTAIFVNYLQSVDPEFYQEINPVLMAERTPFQKARLTELRESFLIESWTQAFLENNIGFNGMI